MSIIPAFDSYKVFVEPWTQYGAETGLVVLMGFLVAAVCGLIGNFIILRRMALIGDAISHSLLPGIALAFLITSARATLPLFIGAIIAGIVTVFLIEFIHKNSKIKPDAAMGIVFSSFFAFGVILITLFADHIDLDTDCVLYGEIAFVPLTEHVMLGGLNLGPYPVVRVCILFITLLTVIVLFYKELLVSVFDPELARFMGVKPKVFEYGLTLGLSLVVVSVFKSVGAILVIGMLLFPGCTARLMADSLGKILALSVFLGLLYSLLGFHLATWLDCSIAGAMTVCAGGLLAVMLIIKKLRAPLAMLQDKKMREVKLKA